MSRVCITKLMMMSACTNLRIKTTGRSSIKRKSNFKTRFGSGWQIWNQVRKLCFGDPLGYPTSFFQVPTHFYFTFLCFLKCSFFFFSLSFFTQFSQNPSVVSQPKIHSQRKENKDFWVKKQKGFCLNLYSLQHFWKGCSSSSWFLYM